MAAKRADPQNLAACASLGALAQFLDNTAMARAQLEDCAASFPGSVEVLYNHLGTEKKDLKPYDTDHAAPAEDRIRETRAWLDKYLGKPERVP